MSTSPYGSKLETKLSALADSASKESIQTLAKWISFNRKHAAAFTSVLTESFKQKLSSPSRYWLYWNLVHEVLIVGVDTPKWDKLLEFRTMIGEMTVVPTVELTIHHQQERRKDSTDESASLLPDSKFDTFLKQWDEYNVFGGPTLVSQIKRLIQSAVASTTKTAPSEQSSNDKKASSSSEDAKNSKQHDSHDQSIGKSQDAGEEVDTLAKESVTEPASIQSSKSADALDSTATDTETKMASSENLSSEATESSKAEKSTNSNDNEPTTTDTIDHADSTRQGEGESSGPKATNSSNDQKNDEALDESKSRQPAQRRTSLTPIKEVTYDFESKNIPQGKVELREIFDPCKAIATLQIARDLRNDAAVQVSSLLASIPEDIKKVCEEAREKQAALKKQQEGKEGENDGDEIVIEELSSAKARDFSIRIPQAVLDMDMDEQLHSIKTFRDIVERQKNARQQLIYLLIKSRCQFGAIEAADMYYKLQKTIEQNQTRKDLLSDAMALEGLDFVATTSAANGGGSNKGDKSNDLPPLTWYVDNEKKRTNNDSDDDETTPKKLRLETD